MTMKQVLIYAGIAAATVVAMNTAANHSGAVAKIVKGW